MDVNSKALEQIANDMDDMEMKKMFPSEESKAGGVDINISVIPRSGEEAKEEEPKEMAEGGIVELPEPENDMPPFLRKKKSKK